MNNLYFIGNAHLDPVWLWDWKEGFFEVTSTFRSALDRMKEFPDFKFASACSAYYEWIEKTDPEMFEEIKMRAKEGRWGIVGGWVIQPDCNIPSGESFARHALISQRYFKEKFGITVKTGYNVDSFGHNASLPKILKKSGMENYVFMRPSEREKHLDYNVFRWQSDDGSYVNTYRIPYCYNWVLEDLKDIHLMSELVEKSGRGQMVFCGIGNHGGGPTIGLLEALKKLDLPGKCMANPDDYFDDLEKATLPVLAEELQHHARGCYSACTTVKAQNRKCENTLLAAEKMSVLAKELVGVPYPKERLAKAWKNVLFNQFHDIMGGCSVKRAYDDAGYLYGETMAIADQIIAFAAHKICRNIDTLQGETLPSNKHWTSWRIWKHEVLGTPIVVFNPHGHKVRVPVRLTMTAKKMTDVNGNEIPFQVIRGDFINGGDKYSSVFMAEVEPMGYAVYRLFVEQESEKTFASGVQVEERVLENDKIRVELSEETGDICSFYDKVNDKYIINRPSKAILLDDTDNDTWAHNKDYLGDYVGEFTNPTFKIMEEGPVRASIRVKAQYGKSELTREFTLAEGSDEVVVKTIVDFQEKHRVLKFAFPFDAEKILAKTAFGTVERQLDTGEESMGSWVAAGGLCVANDSKYAYDTKDNMLRMTVLRSAIYADHYAGEHRDDHCEYMEMGRHEFTYSVFPFASKAESEKKAEVLNFALPAFADSFHDGNLPLEFSAFACNNENVILAAVKESEDSTENVMHLYEMNGVDGDLEVRLFDKTTKVSVGHGQIKVLSEDGQNLNLVEWEETV